MTDDESEARNLKFEPRGSCTIRRLSSGNFALYPLGGVGTPFWIGPIADLGEAYANRPEPTKHQRPSYESTRTVVKAAKVIAGIDLSDLEIDL